MGGTQESYRSEEAQAEADARHLRERYGAKAEAWCEFALTALQPGDPQRRSIRLIAKALDRQSAAAISLGDPTPERTTLGVVRHA